MPPELSTLYSYLVFRPRPLLRSTKKKTHTVLGSLSSYLNSQWWWPGWRVRGISPRGKGTSAEGTWKGERKGLSQFDYRHLELPTHRNDTMKGPIFDCIFHILKKLNKKSFEI